MSRPIGCPNCGSPTLDAWYLDPVKYPGVTFENGEIEFSGASSSIGEGGELTDFSCPECGAVGIQPHYIVKTTWHVTRAEVLALFATGASGADVVHELEQRLEISDEDIERYRRASAGAS